MREVSNIASVTFLVRPPSERNGVEGLTPYYCAEDLDEFNEKKEIIHSPRLINEFDALYCDSPWRYIQEIDWEKITIPKILFLNDLHGPRSGHLLENFVCKNKFDEVFVTYRSAFYEQHPDIDRKRVFWLPFFVDPSIFYNYEIERTIGCMHIGAIGTALNKQGGVYPLRKRAYIQLKDSDFYEFVYRPHDHFGYRPWPTGEAYVALLNKSQSVATCTSIYHYTLLKLFEIPACESVLLCDYIPEMKELGFIRNKNMIEINLESNIFKIVSRLLNNQDRLETVAKAGHDLIHSKHTVKHRAVEFVEEIKRLSEKGLEIDNHVYCNAV
jgi:hypothetical protein